MRDRLASVVVLLAVVGCRAPHSAQMRPFTIADSIGVAHAHEPASNGLALALIATPSLAPLFWSNEVGVLVDGETATGSFHDLGYRFRPWSVLRVIPNLDASAEADEVVAFTRGRGPVRKQVEWDAGANHVQLNFIEPLSPTAGATTVYPPLGTVLPVSVWILAPNPLAPPVDIDEVQEQFAVANTIFWKERLGVLVWAAEITIVPCADPRLLHYTCSHQDLMEETIGKRRGRINVYYTHDVYVAELGGFGSGYGQACTQASGFAVLGRHASDDLLAHELGHSLRLYHTEADTAHFDSENVMHNASVTRTYLAEGQVFRAHFDKKSTLRTIYRLRDDDEFTITKNLENVTVPARWVRVWDDGAFAAGGP